MIVPVDVRLHGQCVITASPSALTHLHAHEELRNQSLKGMKVDGECMEVLAQWFRTLPALYNVRYSLVEFKGSAKAVFADISRELCKRCCSLCSSLSVRISTQLI